MKSWIGEGRGWFGFRPRRWPCFVKSCTYRSLFFSLLGLLLAGCANSSAPETKAQGFWLDESTFVVEYRVPDVDTSSERVQLDTFCPDTALTDECAGVGD